MRHITLQTAAVVLLQNVPIFYHWMTNSWTLGIAGAFLCCVYADVVSAWLCGNLVVGHSYCCG